MKWYIIMKLTYESVEDKKRKNNKCTYEDAKGDGSRGTNGNPDHHWPSIKIKMHELQKAETNPLVIYQIVSTNY